MELYDLHDKANKIEYHVKQLHSNVALLKEQMVDLSTDTESLDEALRTIEAFRQEVTLEITQKEQEILRGEDQEA